MAVQKENQTVASELKLISNKSLAVQGMPFLYSLSGLSTLYFFFFKERPLLILLHTTLGIKTSFLQDVNADGVFHLSSVEPYSPKPQE